MLLQQRLHQSSAEHRNSHILEKPLFYWCEKVFASSAGTWCCWLTFSQWSIINLLLQHCCLSWPFLHVGTTDHSLLSKRSCICPYGTVSYFLWDHLFYLSRLFQMLILSSIVASFSWVASANLKSKFTVPSSTSFMKTLSISGLAWTPLEIHSIHSPIRQALLLFKYSFPANYMPFKE